MKLQREDGNKKSSIKYFTDAQPTDKQGNKLPFTLAKVAACIAHYRKWKRPLKTIYLCPHYYNQVDYWVRKRATEQQGDIKWNMLTFDGVELQMMGPFHVVKSREGSDEMDWDFYTN